MEVRLLGWRERGGRREVERDGSGNMGEGGEERWGGGIGDRGKGDGIGNRGGWGEEGRGERGITRGVKGG